MAESKVDDVVRHCKALEDSLRAEGTLSNENVSKVLDGLRKSLASDGFEINQEESLAPKEHTIMAFRVRSEEDSMIVQDLFSFIPGWQARYLYKDPHHFIIAGNAKRISSFRLTDAVRSYPEAFQHNRDKIGRRREGKPKKRKSKAKNAKKATKGK